MHGMLSLAVLVAAFAGVAGWAAYVSVRLYKACPAARSTPPKVATLATPAPQTDQPAEGQVPSPQPVA